MKPDHCLRKERIFTHKKVNDSGSFPGKSMYVTTVRAVRTIKFLEEGSLHVRMRQLIGREDGARRTALHELTLGKGGYSAKHAHEWDHQLVVTEGLGVAIVAGRKIPLRPGTVLLVQSGEEHTFLQRGTKPLRFLTVTPI